jgi:ADP-heptose:LPS heptosyltransferase
LFFLSSLKAHHRANLLAPRHEIFDFHAFAVWGADPIAKRYKSLGNYLSECLGWRSLTSLREAMPYDFPLSVLSQAEVKGLVERALGVSSKGHFVVVNSFASRLRSLNQKITTQIVLGLIDKLGLPVISLATLDQQPQITRWILEAQDQHRGYWIFLPEIDSLEKTAALIKWARLCVSPDTGIIHLACAVGTPLVGLYRIDGDSTAFFNAQVWAPHGVPYRVVWAKEKLGQIEVDMNSISVSEVIEAAQELMMATRSVNSEGV